MRTRTVALVSLLGVAATLAAAQDVGQHPAVFAPRSLSSVDPSTFVVGHPASPTWQLRHANHEHPAVVVSREAQPLDVNRYLVQPPASVVWTLPGATTSGAMVASR